MNILYASDDNYAEIAAVSIASLLENNRDAGEINFFILDNGLSSQSKQSLSGLVERYSANIAFINVPDVEEIVGVKLHTGYWTIAIFSRLFAASLLPENIEKIIYLDCDTMVRSSVVPLWNESLGENLIGGCEDGIPVGHKESIFLKTTDAYVNSGILLINLKAWRDENVECKFIDFLKLFNGKLRYPDQDVVNAVSKGRVKLVAPKYNSISYYFEYYPELLKQANITDYYSQSELDEARESPVIIHFAGNVGNAGKPWIKGSAHIYQDEYVRYRSITPWKDTPMRSQ